MKRCSTAVESARGTNDSSAHVEVRSEAHLPRQRAERTPAVPYVAMWSGETVEPPGVVERPGRGIGYMDEILTDRDKREILWDRATVGPGRGTPQFASIHTLRQRSAMRRMLCQVCACPADETEDGVLWLLSDTIKDSPNWPDNVLGAEPPTCLPCAQYSVSVCPRLRRGYVALRVRHRPQYGVQGLVYRAGSPFPWPTSDQAVAFDSPAIRWTVASTLLRDLSGCTIVDLWG